MLTIEKLRAWGADVDEAMERCLNNEAFYLRLVDKALQDPNFDRLKDAVGAGNLDKGFEAAHALKGVMANLALTPILIRVQEITELLRNRTQTPLTARQVPDRIIRRPACLPGVRAPGSKFTEVRKIR